MPAFDDFLDNMTGGQRAEALYAYFGWQGGTVHQLATATGLTVSNILYDPITHSTGLMSPPSLGWAAMRTCDRDWRRDRLAPKHLGEVGYWHGVMAGYWLDRWDKAEAN